ncbi:MBL fold metallo-hydrolase [Aspergillus mulundensis]|uniref:Metallo-beta-lactamase domain-containing protein n=1 Tax=Aspergillus mulundensis TaxID=1810919 RepID=A0A3D8S4X4_9EURO|nr:hypothetical protein DSM5745_04807 [Aspergillus mulundensis]RDW81250.1 hypothetical protein DSM5745_04807 [Aspergillus mulundensis]
MAVSDNRTIRTNHAAATMPLQRLDHRHLSAPKPGRLSLSTQATSPSTDKTASKPPDKPAIHSIYEPKTGTWQYIVADPSTSAAAIIDPVLDYDPATHEISTNTADALLTLIKKEGYTVVVILETHAHADHLTAASYLQARLTQEQAQTPPIGIGADITKVQQVFGQKYGIPADEYSGVFGRLFRDNEVFAIGSLSAVAIHLPGHTPDHMGYRIGDNVFAGDSIFHTDLGTARTDFPGGDAASLFRSARRLLSLPEHVRIWVGHDYPSEMRATPVSSVSVGEHRQENKHVKLDVAEEEFVKMRNCRDEGLPPPKLIHPALQVNVRAGKVPPMLKVPVERNGVEW